MRLHILPLAALAAAVLAAGHADAQAVHGRVTEPAGQPVSGAVVMLLDANGVRVAATLSDAQGGYALQAGAPATYSVRAERVGYAAAASGALALEAGASTEQALVMEPRELVLEPLVVTGVGRECTIRPQGAAEAAVVWDELRKALDAAAVGEERRRYAFRRRLFRRDRTLHHRRIIQSQVWTTPEFGTEPFHATPVERLARHGYVESAAGDSMVFHVPDARTLLSDAFLDHHCFRVRERRGSVGLEFAPTADRTLPDVRGTLWLDRRTARLRRLEYTYVNLPYENPDDALGGELEFEQLPDGAWIVRRWVVRMPRLRGTERGQVYVPALVEQGGEVIGIQPQP
jgi:Carboxypeptidase regulatory-like domain